MEYDNEIMELMLREPVVRQLMVNVDREDAPRLTHLRVLAPFDDVHYMANDAGNGYLFADLYGDKARYVADRGCWYVYEGGVWRKDHGGVRVMDLCRRMVVLMNVLAYAREKPVLISEALERVNNLYSLRTREKILRDASTVYPLMAADLDGDQWLFNCLNGTLDLRTGEFRSHQSGDLLTKMANVRYDPSARCPRWEQFVEEIMAVPGEHQLAMGESAGNEKAAYLQRALGYALTGSTKHECMFILYGQSTRNGKGTLMETILRMMGDYGRAAQPETFSSRPASGASHSEDIARLHAARLVSVSEPDRHLTLSAGFIKQITGNDTLTARNLHEGSFEFRPRFKLFISANYLPRVNDLTLFSSGRLRTITFDRHFEQHEQDQGLKELFAQPENLSAVLNWCLEGMKAWQAKGLDEPEAVRRATDRYRRENDWIAQFCDSCLVPEEGARVKTTLVYQRYRAWCEENGYRPDNNHVFWKMMGSRVTVKRVRFSGKGNPTNVMFDYRLE